MPRSLSWGKAALPDFSSRVLFGKHLVEAIGIEANHDLFVHNDGRGRVAIVGANQFHQCRLVRADIFQFKFDTFLRKVILRPGAGRSARLAVEHDPLSHSFLRCCWIPQRKHRCFYLAS